MISHAGWEVSRPVSHSQIQSWYRGTTTELLIWWLRQEIHSLSFSDHAMYLCAEAIFTWLWNCGKKSCVQASFPKGTCMSWSVTIFMCIDTCIHMQESWKQYLITKCQNLNRCEKKSDKDDSPVPSAKRPKLSPLKHPYSSFSTEMVDDTSH